MFQLPFLKIRCFFAYKAVHFSVYYYFWSTLTHNYGLKKAQEKTTDPIFAWLWRTTVRTRFRFLTIRTHHAEVIPVKQNLFRRAIILAILVAVLVPKMGQQLTWSRPNLCIGIVLFAKPHRMSSMTIGKCGGARLSGVKRQLWWRGDPKGEKKLLWSTSKF